MPNTLQDWVKGFEEELNSRFEENIKLIVLNDSDDKTMLLITEIVAEHAGIPVKDLFGEKRGLLDVSDARMIAMYFIHLHTRVTKVSIAKFFGRNHSTVINAIETIKKRITTNDAKAMPLIKRVAACIAEKKNLYGNQI